LIVGSMEAAEKLLREWTHDGASDLDPIGIVSDEPGRHGLRFHGVPTVGTIRELESVTWRLQPDLLVIAVLSSSGKDMRKLVDRCRSTGVAVRIMPSEREVRDGRARAGQLREIRTEDLLGREVVSLDLTRVRAELRGQRVLITGGAGSIGSELARQILDQEPEAIILLDNAETPLYFAQLELRERARCQVVPVIGSVSDRNRMRDVFGLHRPTVVFHAAAFKHVPMMEEHVGEAIRNNVVGTLCVAQSAVEVGVRRFVLISTDKAVNPSCVMGATKRVAERIILGLEDLRRGPTEFRAVRFGNVLGSNGSVIPLFERQLGEHGALTVTHPEVTRYFMTIPEAVQLVLQAASMPEAARRICMLEMGEPVRIVELAESIIRNAGLEPYRDVSIQFTGLRPGEKLHEELLSGVETLVPTSVDKIRVTQLEESNSRSIQRVLDRLVADLNGGSVADQLRALVELVPECTEPLRSRAASPPKAHSWSFGPHNRPPHWTPTAGAEASARVLDRPTG
jgi:FlaA1/EpsC-like NDP-sugar epimerase